MTGFYLLDRRTTRTSYYPTRRGSVLAVVMHITAGLQGRPAGADSSAEQTAKYAATTDRAVSWHSGSDTDSHLQLLPDSYTAFHVQGYNSRTIGHEISKRDVTWADEDPDWVRKTLEQAAACLRPRVAALGIPLRWATKAELDHAIATGGDPVGFVDHSALDPTRRKDPGADFPRDRFLALLGDQGPTHQEDDDMNAEQTRQLADATAGVAQLNAVMKGVRRDVRELGAVLDRLDRAAGGPGLTIRDRTSIDGNIES